MKIYFCHSLALDYNKDLYEPFRESSLNTKHEIIFPHENKFPKDNTKQIIRSCDIVFAEVSLSATGLGIELGWADAFSIPIVCVSKRGIKPSNSLRFITNNFIEYINTKDLVEKVEDFLIEFDSWKETQEILKDKKLMRAIRQSEKEIKEGKWVDWEDAKKELGL